MIPIEWTAPAVSDLQNVVNYISQDSAIYADAMAERIISSCETIASFPQSGRIVPEVSNPKIREIIVGPYRIMYRVKRNVLQILAIIHSARDVKRMNPKPWR